MGFGGVVFIATAIVGAAIIMYVLEPRRVKLAAAEPAPEIPEAKPEPEPEVAPAPVPEAKIETSEKPAEAAPPAAEAAKPEGEATKLAA